MNTEQFNAHVISQVDEAFVKYGIKHCSAITVSYVEKGLFYAKAWKKGSECGIVFSLEAMAKDLDDALKETIPHEIAHLVCFFRPELGRKHDTGWQRVCRQLGGNGNRCGTMKLTRAKNKTLTRYVYLIRGREIRFGPKHHAQIEKYPVTGCLFNIAELGNNIRVYPSQFVRTQQYQMVDGKFVPIEEVPDISNLSDLSGLSKREICSQIYKKNLDKQRKEVIGLFVDHGLTPAAASTYYQNYKSGKW